MAIRAAQPFNAFLAGRQARQDENYAESRNALARMEAENAPTEMANRNRLLDMQVQGAEQQLGAEKAKYAYTTLKQALDSGNPKAFVLQNIPLLAQKLKEQRIDLQSMDDASAEQMIDGLARKYAGEAGIAPAAPAGPLSAQGKIGADVKGGYLTPEQGNAALNPGMSDYQRQRLEIERQRAADGGPLMPVQGPDGKVTYQPRANAVGQSPPPPNREGQSFMQADKLRDEYNAASKDFIAIGDNYLRVREAARDPSAAGDLSLIFAYMKMLDPSSVVREQEFANAQNAAGVPDRVRNAWNKALNGERLNPNQRQDFINQSNKVYAAQNKRHESTVKARYTQMAERFGVDPRNVVGAFDVPDVASNAGPGGQSAPPRGEVRVNTPQEAMALPPGTVFVTPDGRRKVR